MISAGAFLFALAFRVAISVPFRIHRRSTGLLSGVVLIIREHGFQAAFQKILGLVFAVDASSECHVLLLG